MSSSNDEKSDNNNEKSRSESKKSDKSKSSKKSGSNKDIEIEGINIQNEESPENILNTETKNNEDNNEADTVRKPTNNTKVNNKKEKVSIKGKIKNKNNANNVNRTGTANKVVGESNIALESKESNTLPSDINTNPTQNESDNKAMKKSVTTYAPKKKFNKEDFNKQMNNFKDWERKKKEKIEKLKKEQEEKELKLLKDPITNKKANMKFNTNPKNFTAVERLYEQDIKKRKDNKVLLTKIYTPTFKPTIYTKGDMYGIMALQQQDNRNDGRLRAQMKRNNPDEEEEINEELYESKRLKTNRNKRQEKKDDFDNQYTYNPKKKDKKGRRNKSVEKKKVKAKTILDFDNEEEDDEDKDSREEETKNLKVPTLEDAPQIEMTLRDRLFKKKKPIQSRSVGKRRSAH